MSGGVAPALAGHLECAASSAAAGESVPYSVVNDGPVPIVLGEHYSFERLTDRGWERLPSLLMFRAIGYRLSEGAVRELDFRVPEDVQPDRYRLCKLLRVDSDPVPGSEWFRRYEIDPIEVMAEFEVVAVTGRWRVTQGDS